MLANNAPTDGSGWRILSDHPVESSRLFRLGGSANRMAFVLVATGQPSHPVVRSEVLHLVAHDRSYLSAQDFYGMQHFLVRKRGDTHLESDARDATESFVYI